VCRYIDSKQEVFIERLAKAVAIRSVSGCPEERGEVTKMVQYVAKVLGIEVVRLSLVHFSCHIVLY